MYHRTLSRQNLQRLPGRAQKFWDHFNEYDSRGLHCVKQTSLKIMVHRWVKHKSKCSDAPATRGDFAKKYKLKEKDKATVHSPAEERVARLLLSVLHDHCSHTGNCIGLTFEHCPFSLHCQQVPFPLSMPLNHLRLSATAPVSSFFHVWRQNFAVDVSDLCYFSQSSSISDILGIDVFWWISMSYNSYTVLSGSDSRILNLYRLSRISSDGILVIDDEIPSHLVSNSWTLSSRGVTENKSA